MNAEQLSESSPSWAGTRVPNEIEVVLHQLVHDIESAQEYVRRSLFVYSAGPFNYMGKFTHGQVMSSLAGVVGDLEKVRMMIAPSKEGRP